MTRRAKKYLFVGAAFLAGFYFYGIYRRKKEAQEIIDRAILQRQKGERDIRGRDINSVLTRDVKITDRQILTNNKGEVIAVYNN